jgi:AbrB family looped-hinge helix DNA binding protein
MTMKIGPKGQVVIPKVFRDALGLRPGDKVDWDLCDGVLTVEPVQGLEPMRGHFAGMGLIGELERERRLERRR